jgi:hypothetical protein
MKEPRMNGLMMNKQFFLFNVIFKSLIISATFTISTNSIAKEKPFNVGDNKISLHYPNKWQHAYNFLATPLTLFGPVEKGKRPVISINNSNVKNFSFDKKDLTRNQESYKKGRLKWLKKNKGKFVRFSGYRIQKWNNIKEVHSIGYSYTIAKELYLEKTYFFNCKETLFSISTLMTWDQNKNFGKDIKKILSSIKCLK